jgi:hypothetical protein
MHRRQTAARGDVGEINNTLLEVFTFDSHLIAPQWWSTMVVNNFHIPDITVKQNKTDAPFVIYPNTLLSPAGSTKCLQTITRWYAQVVKLNGGIKHQQLGMSALLNLCGQTTDSTTGKYRNRPLVGEATDHFDTYYKTVRTVNRYVQISRTEIGSWFAGRHRPSTSRHSG